MSSLRLLFGLIVWAVPTAVRAEDWPTFLGPHGNSTSREKGIIAPWPKEGLKVLWHAEVGSGYGMPVISGGKLYHFDRHRNQARLTCLDADTGKFNWKFEYPTQYRDKFNYNNGPRACPVIDQDRIYLFGVEGMLHCLKIKDGEVVWKLDTQETFGVIQNFFGVASVPVIEGDLLITMVGGSPAGSDPREFLELKGNGSGIVALDKYTGKVKYKITNELASYASPLIATIAGRRWCFAFARGGLLGFEPSKGQVDFHFPWRSEDLESVNASNPVVVGDQVLITECYGPGSALLKIKAGADPTLVWSDAKKLARRKSLQGHWCTPIHHEGYVYGCSGRHTQGAELRCIELATGAVKWSEPRLTRTSLLMIDGHFICLGEDGGLRLLKVNPEKYEEVSAMEVIDPKTRQGLLEYPCWAAPIVANGLLYVRGDERLVCLALKK